MKNDKTIIQNKENNYPEDKTVIFKPAEQAPIESNDDHTIVYQQSDLAPLVEPIQTSENRPVQEVLSGASLPYIGDTIRDRFVLESLLGIGGMGAVYRAIDKRKQEAKDENPYVAIKLLSEDFRRHPKAFISLQRETQKTQTLAHPNIITVYDFDRDGDVVYMTMEQLEGKTLEEIIRENAGAALDKQQAVSIIRGIATGLSYAHSKGIVHSDLKPGNIFVTKTGQVKVLDFGIARVVQENAVEDQFDAGELDALTPSYASIEMINRCEPDRRDDIYALGVIACELLGGAHPYKRLMATEALEQKLLPKLPGVGRLLKNVLNSAVELEIESRIESLDKWLKKLDFALSGYKKVFGVLVLVICAVIGGLLFLDIVREPEIALHDLTPAMQLSFNEYLNEANVAMSFDDVNGALFYLDKAYKIHSQNDEVTDFIKIMLVKVESSIESKNVSAEEVKEVLLTLNEYEAFQNDKIQSRLKKLIP
ncbi:MAG: serine/threonine protein kinase [Oleiphilaceae bacterium]